MQVDYSIFFTFFTERSTWVLVLQILCEQLQSIYSALKFFQILYTYTAEVKKEQKQQAINKD